MGTLAPGDVVRNVRLHTQAVTDNRAFVGRVIERGETRDYGWGVTGAFSMALHVTRAYFACRGDEVGSHTEGERLLLKYTDIKAAVAPFKALKQLSETARYYNQPMSEKVLKDSLAMAERIDRIIGQQTRQRCPGAFDSP